MLMDMWHRHSLLRVVNYDNTVKPHKGIDGMTPYEKLPERSYGGKV